MTHRARFTLLALLSATAALGMLLGLRADDKAKPGSEAAPKKEASAEKSARPEPKPLSDQVKKGLAYLVSQQHKNGGWGQGGGWRTGGQGGRVEGDKVEDPPDVANTSIAALTLLRAGNTPTKGEYAANVANAVEFICMHVEKADKDSLYVTQVRNTQVQSKIGPFIDTFLAGLVLAEIKGVTTNDRIAQRVNDALQKTIAKIEKHQKEDGSFGGNEAWAAVFSQGLACKCLNRASQNGAAVPAQALERAEKNAIASIDVKNRTILSSATSSPVTAGGPAGGLGRAAARPSIAAAAPSDAGVDLYNFSNQVSALQQAAATNVKAQEMAKKVLADANAPNADKEKAQSELSRISNVEAARQVAVEANVKSLGDARFVNGFGSNGGEEFLSYLNLSETLIVEGGKAWADWDKKITDSLNKVQNKDGSWSGDHCITGRTFCSATALLVLLADRTPNPIATKLNEKKGQTKP